MNTNETFIRHGDRFLFTHNGKNYEGCVHTIIGATSIPSGYYFNLWFLKPEKRKKYWLWGPLVDVQIHYWCGDFWFAGFSGVIDHPFFQMTERVGDEYFLIPDKVRAFARKMVDNYIDDLIQKKHDHNRLKNVTFTQRI